MTDRETPKIWFPAKRYGWGWGPPTVWQGWAVLLVWIVVLVVGSLWIAPRSAVAQVGFAAVMAGVLTAICYAKGERPRWRWGDRPRGGGPVHR